MNNLIQPTFEWFASGNAPTLFPTELVMGCFLFEDLSKLDIPPSDPFADTWGKPVSMHLSPNNFHPAPKYVLMAWFSIVENKFYTVADELPTEQIEVLLAEKNKETKKPRYDTLVAGMAPYGKLAIWLSGNGITTQIAWLTGKEISLEMKDFAPRSKLNREKYAEKALTECKKAFENFKRNGLPDPLLFERYMQKFNYSITPQFENSAEFEGVEIYYTNGELNTTKSGEHTENVLRAKPSKIVLNWRIGKKRYNGYFWTDEIQWIQHFHRCFGDDLQKEAHLIIQVGASNKHFQFLLQTKDVAIEIPIDDLHCIIFKNKFEYYRSPNYKRPPQGWRN